MKKLLTSFALAALCSLPVNAQEAPTSSTATQPATIASGKNQPPVKKNLSTEERIKMKDTNAAKWQSASPEEKQKMMENREKAGNMSSEEREKMKTQRMEKKDDRQEKYNNASPEMKAKMDEHRAVMEKLSPEKREAAKAEMKRHREAMKAITGVELPMPPKPNTNQQH